MENWLVMLAAMAIVCVIYPPVLGVFIGIGIMAGATYIVFKLLGG